MSPQLQEPLKYKYLLILNLCKKKKKMDYKYPLSTSTYQRQSSKYASEVKLSSGMGDTSGFEIDLVIMLTFMHPISSPLPFYKREALAYV